MSLRCLVFSSDEGTTAILRQILSGVGVEGEFCSTAVSAAEQITNQRFQIVIIDWDQQPEAGVLLNTARERKAAERPLTLTIVSKDADAPEALHAGANSLLRKPLVANQARETLTTARDLLRSKQGPATALASSPVLPVVPDATGEATLRAGEFLQTPTLAPGGLVETEATLSSTLEESEPIASLKDLEPMASSVAEKREPAAVTPSSPSGSRGLEWYLKNRPGGQAAASSAAAAAPTPVAPAAPDPARGNPELLGYDQSSSYAAAPAAAKNSVRRTKTTSHTGARVARAKSASRRRKRSYSLTYRGRRRARRIPLDRGSRLPSARSCRLWFWRQLLSRPHRRPRGIRACKDSGEAGDRRCMPG